MSTDSLAPNCRQCVYVSGPLSLGGKLENVFRAINAGCQLVQLGFAPLIPHLTYFADPEDELGYGAWLEVDLAWLPQAAAVLRLPGESKGADQEVAEACRLGIPVFHDVETLASFFGRE